MCKYYEKKNLVLTIPQVLLPIDEARNPGSSPVQRGYINHDQRKTVYENT